ncbi:MAG: hypothetical protein IKC26_05895 [Clostridia bacterium]|nr:hypothetical protein [Clostridia bacterium]
MSHIDGLLFGFYDGNLQHSNDFFKGLLSALDLFICCLIADLNKRLKDKQLKVEISDAAKEHIIDSAYDPIYGARPLKRFIQSKIETLLAREIIGGDIEPDTTLEIDYDNSTLVIK